MDALYDCFLNHVAMILESRSYKVIVFGDFLFVDIVLAVSAIVLYVRILV